MSSTLISGVRGVMYFYKAVGRMGVFFARTGTRQDSTFITAIVVVVAIPATVSLMPIMAILSPMPLPTAHHGKSMRC